MPFTKDGTCVFDGRHFLRLLTSTRPFMGHSYEDILLKVVTMDPIAAAAIRPDIPPELNSVVMKAMAKNPEYRFQSMDELAYALAPFKAGSGPGRHRQVASDCSSDWQELVCWPWCS